jgi:protein-disulfide isomerase
MAVRRRRVGVPVAIAFALTVAAIVLSVAAGARSSNVAAAEARMQKALARVPQHGPLLGKPSAPVTVYEFADLQCPYCGNYMTTLFPKLLADDVVPGKVKMVLNPVVLLGKGSRWGAQASVAAADQNKMWNFADAFYYNQGPENSGYVTTGFLRQIGSDVPGMNVSRLMVDTYSSATLRRAKAMQAFARYQGVVATPTFLVERADGRSTLVVGSGKLEDAINQALAASGRKSATGQNVE